MKPFGEFHCLNGSFGYAASSTDSTEIMPAGDLSQSGDEESVTASLQQATAATEVLSDVQSEVDRLIEAASKNPEMKDVYEKLTALRSESRGFFEEYVAPGWKAITDYAKEIGLMGVPTAHSGLGFLPLIAWGAAIAGSAALIAAAYAYVEAANTSIERERMILNDPSLSQAVKEKLLQSGSIFSGLTELSGSVKGMAYLAGGLVAAYFIYTRYEQIESKVGRTYSRVKEEGRKAVSSAKAAVASARK